MPPFGKDKSKDEFGDDSTVSDDKQATDLETGTVRSPDNVSDTTVNNAATNDEVPSEEDAAENNADASDVVNSQEPSLPQVNDDFSVDSGVVGGTRLDEVHARQEAEYRQRREAEINALAAKAAEEGVEEENSSVPETAAESKVVGEGDTFQSTGATVVQTESGEADSQAVGMEEANKIPETTNEIDDNNDDNGDDD